MLEQIAIREDVNNKKLIRRAKIVLHCHHGLNNHRIAAKLRIERGAVRRWRDRWLAASPLFCLVEEEEGESELDILVQLLLEDEPRPGGASHVHFIARNGIQGSHHTSL